MSKVRTFSFLHIGDYFSYNHRIYQIVDYINDYDADENSFNVVQLSNHKKAYFKSNTKVNWLPNYSDFKVIK